MKPIPDLDDLLAGPSANGVFGTKMRSVIKLADAGRRAVVDQQFESAADPRRRPRADHRARGRHPQPEKAEAEGAAKPRILGQLDASPADQLVMLKLTLPDEDDFYADARRAPEGAARRRLSGGYSREEANARWPATTA
jgi:fructose-bisphosphate aldolase, class I